MTPSTTLALLAALYHWKDINEPERLREDMGNGDHNGSGAGDDCSVLEPSAPSHPIQSELLRVEQCSDRTDYKHRYSQ